jgi:hypothetical protein
LKDAGTPSSPGTDIQRLQMVKGWVDADGVTHVTVIDIAGDANNGAGVNGQTCQPIGQSLKTACTVWQDEKFDPAQGSFYYVRVLENPTCRWRAHSQKVGT